MAAGTLVSLDDIRASVKRFQQEGGRFVDRIRQDASDIVSGRRKASSILESLQQARTQALEDIEARRERVWTLVNERLVALADSLRRGIGAANGKDVDYLGRRIADLEAKVEKLAKDQAAA
jgi:cell division septum initiation protein DivIVA